MRRIFIFLSCLITVPAMAADDACTKPREFTTDKRCYVNYKQRAQKPFNATVKVITPDGGTCTGTIVKGYRGYENKVELDDDTMYVYTAKHCTGVFTPAESLEIQLQNWQRYTVKFVRAGYYSMAFKEGPEGDYALYEIVGASPDIPYTKLSDKRVNGFVFNNQNKVNSKWELEGISGTLPARIVGYGALKIMSDAEIETFHNKYKSFLKSIGENTDVGFTDGGVSTSMGYGKQFVKHLASKEYTYYRDIFNNKELKVSECQYLSTGAEYGCQRWSGNSGSGIFDSNGNLMGILTEGSSYIGGARHAGREGFDDINEEGRSTRTIPIAFK